MVSFTPRSVYLHGNNLGYALDKRPKSVWKLWDREIAFPAGDKKLIPIYRLVCSIVTISTELSWLQNIVLQCRYLASLSKHHKVRSAWKKILTIVASILQIPRAPALSRAISREKICFLRLKAVPWIRRLIAGLSARRSVYDPRRSHGSLS